MKIFRFWKTVRPIPENLKNIKMKTFRFDDVCINANMETIKEVTKLLLTCYPDAKIIYAISPLVHNGVGEKVFPKELNPLSGNYARYKVTNAGIPAEAINESYINRNIYTAGHGLIHIDHRLLHKCAQEMSIVASCSLAQGNIFVPPFNKWNKDTEEVCKENNIELVKFEDGWLSMEHNKMTASQDLWYLHARDFGPELVKKWLTT